MSSEPEKETKQPILREVLTLLLRFRILAALALANEGLREFDGGYDLAEYLLTKAKLRTPFTAQEIREDIVTPRILDYLRNYALPNRAIRITVLDQEMIISLLGTVEEDLIIIDWAHKVAWAKERLRHNQKGYISGSAFPEAKFILDTDAGLEKIEKKARRYQVTN